MLQAVVRFYSFTASATMLVLRVQWAVDSAFATSHDVVKLYNSKGCSATSIKKNSPKPMFFSL